MSTKLTITALAAALSLPACASLNKSWPLTTADGRRIEGAEPATCSFKIMNTLPGEDYEEIGTVEWRSGLIGVVELEKFREKVAPSVCEAHGDVVVPEQNGDGWYLKGAVFRAKTVSAR